MNFNFTTIEKQVSVTMPDSIVRIGFKSITVSENIMRQFAIHEVKGASNSKVNLSIGFDDVNKAIKLSYSPKGYSFQLNVNGTGYLHLRGNMLRVLEFGDYQLVPETTNIFQLTK